MKSTGITRKVDDLGRITIPKEIRSQFKIYEQDPLDPTPGCILVSNQIVYSFKLTVIIFLIPFSWAYIVS